MIRVYLKSVALPSELKHRLAMATIGKNGDGSPLGEAEGNRPDVREKYLRMQEISRELTVLRSFFGIDDRGGVLVAFGRHSGAGMRRASSLRQELAEIWNGMSAGEQDECRRIFGEQIERKQED